MDFLDEILFNETSLFLSQFEANWTSYYSDHYEPLSPDDYESLKNEFWGNESNIYPAGAFHDYHYILSKELEQFNSQNKFFRFCKFSTYKDTFSSRFTAFIKEYEDAELMDFIKEEITVYLVPFAKHDFFQFVDDSGLLRLNLAKNKTLSFLLEKGEEIGIEFIINKNSFTCQNKTTKTEKPIENNIFEWVGDKSNLIEVIEALLINGNIKGKKHKAQTYRNFSSLFGEDLSNHDNVVQTFKSRAGSATRFLDELKVSLTDKLSK